MGRQEEEDLGPPSQPLTASPQSSPFSIPFSETSLRGGALWSPKELLEGSCLLL